MVACVCLPSAVFAVDLNVDTTLGNSPFAITAGTTTTYGSFLVGNAATGVVNQSGGAITSTGSFIVASSSGTTGTYNLSGGLLTASGGLSIGQVGNGTFNQTGGIFNGAGSTFNLTLGQLAGAIGTLNLSAGTFSDRVLVLGTSGTGTVNQTGGTHNVTSNVILGQVAGGTGTYNLNGGTLQASSVTGGPGTGTFNFNGGTLQAAGSTSAFFDALTRANVRNGGAVFNTNGFNITVAEPLVHSNIAGDAAVDGGLTKNGAGTLTLSGVNTYTGGTSVNAGTLAIATGSIGVAGSVATTLVDTGGTFSLSGTGTVTDQAAWIGRNGSGTFTQSAGTHTVVGTLYTGFSGTNSLNAATSGTYNLSGGTLQSNSIQIANGGAGTFAQTGGTNTSNGNTIVGLNGGTGAYNISAGTLNSVGIAVGLTGNGTFTQTGGTVNTTTTPLYLSLTATGNGTYNLNGGTLNAIAVITGGTGSSVMNFNGGTLRAFGNIGDYVTGLTRANIRNGGAIIDSNNFNVTIAQPLVHSNIAGDAAIDGGLTKTGANILNLVGANTYTGNTTVNAGTLTLTGGSIGVAGSTATLLVNGPAASAAAMQLTNASLTTQTSWIGRTGPGTFTQLAGTHTVGGTLYIGFADAGLSPAVTGTYNFSGGSMLLNSEQLGNFGTGVVNQTGGTATASNVVYLGLNGGNGTYNLSGGTLASKALLVGFTGAGVFNQSGTTTLTVTDPILVGNAAGDTGTFNLNGGTANASGLSSVTGATSTFNFNGGTLRPTANSAAFLQGLTRANVRNSGAIIDTNGFNITINQPLLHSNVAGDAATDGGLTKNGNGTLTLTAANAYTGVTQVNAGTLAIPSGTVGVAAGGSNFIVDGDPLSSATSTLSGTGTLRASNLWVGRNKSGTFTQSGGTLNISANSNIWVGYTGDTGVSATSVGVFNLSGGTVNTSWEQAGNGGNGTINQSGGINNVGTTLLVGVNGGTGTFNLSGTGELNVGVGFAVGYNGPGTFNQTGGTVNANGEPVLLVATPAHSGTYNLNGGTLNTIGVTTISTGNSTLNFNGGTIKPRAATSNFINGLTRVNVRNAGAVIDTNGFNVTVPDSLLHSNIAGDAATDGGLTKLGAGTLTLANTNTYTGTTKIQAGTLRLAPAAQNTALTSLGGIDVQNGILLIEYGSLSPIGFVKTILDAGYTGNFATGQIKSTTLTAGRTLGYGDNGSGTITVRPTLPGDADLNGVVNFNDFLILQNNFGNAGTRFDQGNFDFNGTTNFNDFLVLQNNFGQSVTGAAVQVTAAQVAAMQSFAQAVPEPASLGLAGLAAAGLLGRCRRSA